MMSLMVWGMIVLFALAVMHFAYEIVILPSVHTALRYRLFALRDRIRRVTYLRSRDVHPRVLRILDDTVNGAIRYLPTLDLSTFLAYKKALETDRELRDRVAARMKLLHDCDVDEIRSIRKDYYRIAKRANIANNFMLFIYICIIIIPLVWLCKASWRSVKSAMKAMVFISEAERNQIAQRAKMSPT